MSHSFFVDLFDFCRDIFANLQYFYMSLVSENQSMIEIDNLL